MDEFMEEDITIDHKKVDIMIHEVEDLSQELLDFFEELDYDVSLSKSISNKNNEQ